MATTRIIPMHINKGKTIAQCLTDRIDYATNPEKTNGGELISSFGCDYHTADAEFLLRKKQYDELKQRNIRNEIIAYQIRQSFKPGEVTPEEANKIGYEFASRLLKGNHAFIVATHVNTNCIHNHIIYSPIRFDLSRKWKDVRRSHKDIARLSDLVCIEHNLSVVTKQPESKIGNVTVLQRRSYRDMFIEENRFRLSHRDFLKIEIDNILDSVKPKTYEEFVAALSERGFEVTSNRYVSVKHKNWKQGVTFYSLGNGYSEQEIKDVIAGRKTHEPMDLLNFEFVPQLLSVLEEKAKNSSGAYAQKLRSESLKQLSQTVLYIQQNNLSVEGLGNLISEKTARRDELKASIDSADEEIKKYENLKSNIIAYSKHSKVYAEYKNSGFSKAYYTEHKTEIEEFKAAKRCFDQWDFPDHKITPLREVNKEIERLKQERSAAKDEYYPLMDEIKKMMIHYENIKLTLGIKDDPQEPEEGEKKSVLEKLRRNNEKVDDRKTEKSKNHGMEL